MSQILLSLSASFKCTSHMNVPVLGFLWQSNTENNHLGHETRFPQQSSSSHNGKQQFNLFCCYFRRSAFYRALLESKTHTPVLEILATKTHYPNIPRLQQTSCATLVGHLNNAFYISRKKNPTRCCILEATINRVAAVWAGMYSVCKCTASPKETTTRRRNSV